MASADDSQPPAEQLAAVSALADGTLDPARRSQVEAMIAGSPELERRFAHERRAVEVLRGAAQTDRAPPALRARLEAERMHRRPAPRWRLAASGALAAAVVALGAVIGLGLAGGSPAPSLAQAAALADRGPSMVAPGPDPDAPGVRLQQSVEDVYFPNWRSSLGWRPTGQREDALGAHRAVTVYYARGAGQIAYTILSAPALAQPAVPAVDVGGTSMRQLIVNGRPLVTWRRQGHTCVLTGTHVNVVELERLAAWPSPAAA